MSTDRMRHSHKITALTFFMLILILPIASSVPQATITKHTKKDTIEVDEPVEVVIKITNNKNEMIYAEVIDLYPKFARIVDKEVDRRSFVPQLRWNITLNPGKSEIISYKMDFSQIPLSSTGTKNVSVPKAVLKYNDKEIRSESGRIRVTNISKTEDCNYNFECEPELGENSETCIQDCPVGGEDNHCDKIEDGKCDPDCYPGQDPDCAEKERETDLPERRNRLLELDMVLLLTLILFAIGVAVFLYKKGRNGKRSLV